MSAAPDSLDALFARLADGDRSAFTPVFQQLWEPTLRLCTRLMGSEADGADAAQTAMVRVLERANEYDRARPALPWALGIASWECRTLKTKQARQRTKTAAGARESDEGAAVEEQERRLLLEAAMTAMGTLSASDQETLLATYWERATPASGATLRQRRARALTRLKDAFRRLYGLD
ncbi:MAG: sigma-70 family RNA polymerase sigma factor [Myxococcaceae bacterium]|nr:sigma-70 family RNA polymerase sigma factor [Myxococcaceae bacterium]